MLHKRYNKQGALVLVDKDNLKTFEKIGYEFKSIPAGVEAPVVEEVVEVEEVVAEIVEEVEEVKPAPKKRTRKPKVVQADPEKDIVLE